MKNTVSVIILVDEDKFSTRCIKSIQRQVKLKNVEIFLLCKNEIDELKSKHPDLKIISLGKEKAYDYVISDVCKKITSDYIFLLSENMVISGNYIDAFLQAVRNKTDDTLITAHHIKKDKEIISRPVFFELSVYGKMISRDTWIRLRDLYKDRIDDNMLFLEICAKKDKVHYLDAYIYDNGISKNDIYLTDLTGQMQFAEWINKVFELKLYENIDITKKLEAWLDDVKEKCFEGSLLYEFAQKMPANTLFHLILAEKLLPEIYKKMHDEKNRHMYDIFKKYFSCFESDEGYTDILLDRSGIKKVQYDYIMKSNSSNYFKIIEKHKEKRERFLKNKAIENKEIGGPDLADFIVERFKDGDSGLKTLLRSLNAWAKNKINKSA